MHALGVVRLAACVFTVLQLSLVLSAAQVLAWPLDWVGLRHVRVAFTHVYAHAFGESFVLWTEHIIGASIVITGDALPRNERVLPCVTT